MSLRKIVFITGANTGVGYQVVRALADSKHAYSVFVGGRSSDKVDAAIQDIKQEFASSRSEFLPVQIDVESDESIEKAIGVVKQKFDHVDILVNNAGSNFDGEHQAGKMSERELWNKSWNVNVSGAQVLTTGLVPLLIRSSDPRILFITSGVSSLTRSNSTASPFDKAPPKGWPKTDFGVHPSAPAYRSVKTGLNMLMREWHRILKSDGVKVWGVSPGFLATNLSGDAAKFKQMGAGDPQVAGPFIRSIIEGDKDAHAGQIIDRKEGIQPW